MLCFKQATQTVGSQVLETCLLEIVVFHLAYFTYLGCPVCHPHNNELNTESHYDFRKVQYIQYFSCTLCIC